MSKRVAGNRGVKSRNFAYRKVPQYAKRKIKQLKQHEQFMLHLQKEGEVDTEKFDIPTELAAITGRIKNFFRQHRQRTAARGS